MNYAPSNHHIRVLVVDDSPLMIRQITTFLREAEGVQVVGHALDGEQALAKVAQLKPDVITLDVEMPRMNGITALKHIMVKYGIPTVMISALTTEGARITFDALKYGAVDVIAKPSRRADESLDAQKNDIVARVKRAAAIRIGRARYVRMPDQAVPAETNREPMDASSRLIGVAAGTGGYYSLLRIVPCLPSDFRHVLVAMVQLTPKYLDFYATYLAEHASIPVKFLRKDEVPLRGSCYLCSADDRVTFAEDDDGETALRVDPVGNDIRQEGTVDILFRSVAESFGGRSVGLVLSGAGREGAEGIHSIRSAGGTTVVQAVNNCLDPSMPLAVLEKGPVEKMLPDHEIAQFLTDLDYKVH
ncbi:MAG: chemotaxis protein CheB [Thermodesulfobacteriota bacterium]